MDNFVPCNVSSLDLSHPGSLHPFIRVNSNQPHMPMQPICPHAHMTPMFMCTCHMHVCPCPCSWALHDMLANYSTHAMPITSLGFPQSYPPFALVVPHITTFISLCFVICFVLEGGLWHMAFFLWLLFLVFFNKGKNGGKYWGDGHYHYHVLCCI